MKSFRDETGQTLVLSALLMCMLMGFMALAIDVGVLFRSQRHLQTEADAAAVAGALSAYYGGTSWATVAKNAAIANGMPTADNFAANNGPLYGQHTGTGYFEVIITEPSPSMFMSTFFALARPWLNTNAGSAAYMPMTVGARAVAGIAPGTTCMYVLNPTAADALYVKGGQGGSKGNGASIYAPGCTIQVNSSNASAICTTGGNATIDSSGILVHGAQGSNGNCSGSQSGVQSGVSQVANPFAGMTTPSSTDCSSSSGAAIGLASTYPTIQGVTITAATSSTVTLSGTVNGTAITPQTFNLPSSTNGNYTPGSSTSGVNLVCFTDTQVSVASNVCLGGGSYCGQNLDPKQGQSGPNLMFDFENGVALNGNNTINGTLLIPATGTGGNPGIFCQGSWKSTSSDANPQCNFAGASTLYMNAPTLASTSQPYTGFGLMVLSNGYGCDNSTNSMPTQPSGDGCLQLQFGSSGGGIVGMVYAPNDALFMQDSGATASVTNLIADVVWDNSALNINNYNNAYISSPLDVVQLVE